MIEKYEKEIPLGIVACTPGRMALVKLEAGVYARVYVRENKVVPNPEPYNLAFHGIEYMKKKEKSYIHMIYGISAALVLAVVLILAALLVDKFNSDIGFFWLK